MEQIVRQIQKKLRKLATLYPWFFFWADVLPKNEKHGKILKEKFSKRIDDYIELLNKQNATKEGN